ncbi:MAG: hypothetical protein AUJ92_18735 [Armatimonadetes bacterium CG2_30_59_28]|nr:MAG: hypothetical protein AUJ92_18735 [Armatimonadetes bacterium CG2_30_59_28]PIU65188.1 MAG: hypothetical protein COS85_09770 [Armatimonadetes bacterium CG07_land_8_20_14_0_80_59_28]PIX42167.1 MAG: hypothetical protein COZ56_10005 [Armatimonadetes bacterium CG_4_8_14_3_um_filter_58_9]PIY40121.1 MAG: hypothetical protein COZ05_18165 [Armatimonadetes bacterium CG_4_10_14_3_um_filter_59_10]
MCLPVRWWIFRRSSLWWWKPGVLARQEGGQLSYPYLFERRPGELWAIAGFAFQSGWKEPVPLRVKVSEDVFFRQG